MAKPRLTQQEHTELGSVLAGIRDELQHQHMLLGNAYPRYGAEGRAVAQLGRALDLLENVRTELDHAVFREHPETAQPTDYYPATEDRAEIKPPRHVTRSRS